MHDTEAESRVLLSRTNFYQVMPSFYDDLLTFSNACLLMENDDEELLRFTSIPIGEWYVANDQYHRIRTYGRRFQLTVRQVVEKFCTKKNGMWDFTNVSNSVEQQFINGNTENWVQLVHFIMPNDNHDPSKLGPKGKKYLSVYYEYGNLSKLPYGDYGSTTGGEMPLRVSGYRRFPILVGRWGVTSGDVYGSWGPTDIAIGDIRELQFFARMQAEATLKEIDPALKGGGRLRKLGRNPRPGEVVWLQDPKSADSLSRIYDFKHDIEHTTRLREYIRQAIRESYYVDMFMRFTQGNRQYLTAKQVAAEENEKLIELAPMLELLNKDVLGQVIEADFERAMERDLLPEPPEELQGEDVTIEYTSMIHQAQKLLDAEAIERFTGYIGGIAQMKPSVLDKVNEDELAERYGSIASIPPGILRSDAEVAEKRAADAERQRQITELENAEQASQAAKNLAQSPVGEGNALEEVARATA